MSSLENNKALVRRFYEEAWNQKNLGILEDTHASDWVHYDPSNPADLRDGPQGNRERLAEVIVAFPDICYTLEDLIAEGDRVVARFTVRGTQRGAFGPIPATGRAVTMQGVIIHRIRDGKIAEDWVVRDTLGLMQQLGVIPAPGAAEAGG